jgi:F-type H+-transporting ATPase subunit delta
LISGSIARRYAKALLALGVDTGRFEKYGTEVERFAALLADKTLRDTLENPSFPFSKRKAIVEALVSRLGLEPHVSNFIRLLMGRGRLATLPAIAREYQALADRHAGRVRARVTSAAPLDARSADRLVRSLEAKTGKSVLLEQKTEPELIAGLVTQIGSTLFDGSLRTQLAEMRQALLESGR